MLIKILDMFKSNSDNSTRIRFIYDLINIRPWLDNKDLAYSESLIGVWVGGTCQKGRWYDVEIAVDDLTWNSNIFEVDKNEPIISNESNDIILLKGQLDITQDGFVTVVIGRSVLMCNLVGLTGPISTFVEIRTKKMTLYDTGTLSY